MKMTGKSWKGILAAITLILITGLAITCKFKAEGGYAEKENTPSVVVEETPDVKVDIDVKVDADVAKVKSEKGCCSHHKGVCSTDEKGRVVCCDGTISMTCRHTPQREE